MRLINTSSIELEEFHLSGVPQYAILSHTWGDDEVTFQDMSSSSRYSRKGYHKIMQTCRLARENEIRYAWIDTCCIDKSSSAELTESINSMFQWYKKSTACYVLLTDLPPNVPAKNTLASCRWFSRGWTLQEMLAPKDTHFYDLNWTYRGSMLEDFSLVVSKITKVPLALLLKQRNLGDYSVAERMSWASQRRTTRIEDAAYCLLGIFDVNMPLVYGEGHKAFRRLQEEIVKRSNDLSLFAWETSEDQDEELLHLFATSPAAFANSARFRPYDSDFTDFSITNKGVLISRDTPMQIIEISQPDEKDKILRYFLPIWWGSGLCLRKLGPKVFYRDGKLPLGDVGRKIVGLDRSTGSQSYYILTDPMPAHSLTSLRFRLEALHVPSDVCFTLEEVAPESLWDITDRLFLLPNPQGFGSYPTAIAMAFTGAIAGAVISLVVLCKYTKDCPTFRVFERSRYHRQAAMIFQGRCRENSMLWADLEFQAPELLSTSNSTNLRVKGKSINIEASFERKVLQIYPKDTMVWALNFKITRQSRVSGYRSWKHRHK